MKIIFLGFGKVGFLCLSELIKQFFNIVGVVPRANDLGNSDDIYSVRNLAIKSSIPLYSHDDVKFAVIFVVLVEYLNFFQSMVGIC